MSNSTDQAVATVYRLFTEVFQDGDLDRADELLSEDFRFQYPFPGFAAGPEGIKQLTKAFHEGFPGFAVEINDLFGSHGHRDSRVAIRWTLTGTHTGDFLGIAASGSYVTVSAIGLYHQHHGHRGLSAGWLELDTVGLLGQIGAIAPTNELFPGLRGQ